MAPFFLFPETFILPQVVRRLLMPLTHHDLLPLVILGEVDVGPEFGAADGRAHEVVLQVGAVHQALHDVVTDDLKAQGNE